MGSTLPIASADAREVVATGRDEITVLEIIANSRNGAKWFPGLAKKLSREKAAPVISHLTGERERTCYDWCAGETDPPARVVFKLLHSNAGWLVLEYIMRGCRERWWLDMRRDRALAAAASRFKAEVEQATFEFE